MARGSKSEQLALHEELVLLCLHDRKGTIISATSRFGVAGALVAELLLQELISVDMSRRRKLIDANNSRWLNEPILNECLQKIRTAKRRARLSTWVSRFADLSKLEHRIAEQLCRRGILRADEGKLLLIFKQNIYPEIDPGPERAVIERLREAIFTDTNNISPRTAILASLANASALLHPIFGRKELKPRKRRLKQLATGQLVGQGAEDAVNAAQAAASAATTAIQVAAAAIVTS